MKKAEYIERYGEEKGLTKWQEYLEKCKIRKNRWRNNHPELRLNKEAFTATFGEEEYLKFREKENKRGKIYRETHPYYHHNYYEDNKEQILLRQKNNYQHNIEINPNFNKENYQKILAKNPDLQKERYKKKIESNPNFNKDFYDTIKGRAPSLSSVYKQADKERGFDVSNNVKGEWIVKNIFSGQKCVYCGDSDWRHLGCDRIDNTKPHTADNIVCACGVCNMERADRYTVEEFKEYRKLHPRACDIPKATVIQLSETGAIKKRTIN